jgi:hypothetical protein
LAEDIGCTAAFEKSLECKRLDRESNGGQRQVTPSRSQFKKTMASVRSGTKAEVHKKEHRRNNEWNPLTKYLILAVIVLLILAQAVSSCTANDYDFRRIAVDVEPPAKVSRLQAIPADLPFRFGPDELLNGNTLP